MRRLLRHLRGVDRAEGVDWLAGCEAFVEQVPELAGHDGRGEGLVEGAALGDDVFGGPVALDACEAGGGPPFADLGELGGVEGFFGGAGFLGLGEELEDFGGGGGGGGGGGVGGEDILVAVVERDRGADGEGEDVVEGEVVKTAVVRRVVVDDDDARRGTAPPLRRIARRSIWNLWSMERM